mmetsp:Transcript_26288/g.63101  ORF Transcript_26288/g.63101 Transcript_26288/m.63101 type:complete len:217 (-) Transcript_26288:1242-1892(-)
MCSRVNLHQFTILRLIIIRHLHHKDVSILFDQNEHSLIADINCTRPIDLNFIYRVIRPLVFFQYPFPKGNGGGPRGIGYGRRSPVHRRGDTVDGGGAARKAAGVERICRVEVDIVPKIFHVGYGESRERVGNAEKECGGHYFVSQTLFVPVSAFHDPHGSSHVNRLDLWEPRGDWSGAAPIVPPNVEAARSDVIERSIDILRRIDQSRIESKAQRV